MRKVIISLTSIPSRVEKIKPCIDSLVNQTYDDYEIYMWLPKSYKRGKGQQSKIPKFLKHDKINVRLTEDLGPITKLIPTLQLHRTDDVIIVTADDDVKYPPNWLKHIVSQFDPTKKIAIGYRGRRFNNEHKIYKQTTLYQSHTLVKYKDVDILTGTWGIAYHPSFFKDDFYVLPSGKNYFVDDIWINGHLAKNDVKRRVIAFKEQIQPTNYHNVDSLWSMNQRQSNNDNTIQMFKNYF